MGVKSDKTFEEIVERLVALFRPQAEPHRDTADEPPPVSQPVGSAPDLSPTSSEEDTQ